MSANNVTATIEKGELVIRCKIDAKAVAGAPLSKTGKTKLVASTAGSLAVPGSNLKLALNLMAPTA